MDNETFLRKVLELIKMHDHEELAEWIESEGGYSVEHINDRNHVLALIYHAAEIALAKTDGDGSA
jgi:hypothetical protein